MIVDPGHHQLVESMGVTAITLVWGAKVKRGQIDLHSGIVEIEANDGELRTWCQASRNCEIRDS